MVLIGIYINAVGVSGHSVQGIGKYMYISIDLGLQDSIFIALVISYSRT